MNDRAIKFPALHKVLSADRTVNYRGYQIDLSEHSGGWWYDVYPPGGEKNIGGVLSVPFDRADQAEQSAKQDVDQHMAEYGERAAAALTSNYPSLVKVLSESSGLWYTLYSRIGLPSGSIGYSETPLAISQSQDALKKIAIEHFKKHNPEHARSDNSGKIPPGYSISDGHKAGKKSDEIDLDSPHIKKLLISSTPFEEPVRDETDDEDAAPLYQDKHQEAALPIPKDQNLPVNVKRDLIKDLYGAIGEKMFGFSPQHIQWMHGAIDKVMSDSDVTKEWEFIRKGNVEKLLRMMQQMQHAGPEDTPELEEMQGLWDSIARGIIQTKQANKEISQEEWDLVEDSLMGFVDKFTDKLEKKADKALPMERKRLGSALTEAVVAGFFLPRADR